jgi:hypothetical protein
VIEPIQVPVDGFRRRLILTQERPSYPGDDEKRWSLPPRQAAVAHG